MMKHSHVRVLRPGSKGTDPAFTPISPFTWYVRLPVTRWLWRWRRRLGIRLADDPPLNKHGFTMRGHVGPGSSHHSFADWKREYDAPSPRERQATRMKRARRMPGAQRAASAMVRGAIRVRRVGPGTFDIDLPSWIDIDQRPIPQLEHPMHMDT